MNTKLYKLSMVTFVVATLLCVSGYGLNQQSNTNKRNPINKVKKSEQEWVACLTPEEYQILMENVAEYMEIYQFRNTS